jgi:hypothetical protein
VGKGNGRKANDALVLVKRMKRQCRLTVLRSALIEHGLTRKPSGAGPSLGGFAGESEARWAILKLTEGSDSQGPKDPEPRWAEHL